MSDTAGVPAPEALPERVWLTPDPYAMSGDWWADGKTVREDGEVPYVPEQRALEAERERDDWKRISDGHFERAERAEAKNHDDAVALADKIDDARDQALLQIDAQCRALRAERDALQSDLKALLPLARAGLNAYDYAMAKQVYGYAEVPVLDSVSIMESLTAARAILSRETS